MNGMVLAMREMLRGCVYIYMYLSPLLFGILIGQIGLKAEGFFTFAGSEIFFFFSFLYFTLLY